MTSAEETDAQFIDRAWSFLTEDEKAEMRAFALMTANFIVNVVTPKMRHAGYWR